MARRIRTRKYRHRPNPAMQQPDVAMSQLALDFDDLDEDEYEIRLAWRELTTTRLPAMARTRKDWPVRLDHCFARILLDNAVGEFWRDVIKAPAWKNTPLPVLQTAIDLGEAILTDDADIWTLNDASLKMRGKPPRGKKPAARPRIRRRRVKSKRP